MSCKPHEDLGLLLDTVKGGYILPVAVSRPRTEMEKDKHEICTQTEDQPRQGLETNAMQVGATRTRSGGFQWGVVYPPEPFEIPPKRPSEAQSQASSGARGSQPRASRVTMKSARGPELQETRKTNQRD